MSTASDTPPKFVPTLTDVVALPGASETTDVVDVAQTTEVAPVHTAAGPEVADAADADGEHPAAQPQARPAWNAGHSRMPEPPVLMDAVELGEALEALLQEPEPEPERAPGAEPEPEPLVAPVAMPEGYEEYVVHRVMQRVDVLLEHRLREAIATVIQEQTRSIVPRLREEVESVVRQSVYEAVADELANHK